MNGYRALPLRPQKAYSGNDCRTLTQVCFSTQKRALQEGMRRVGESGPSTGLSVEEVSDLHPHYVRWSDYPGREIHEDVVLLPPNAIATSTIDLYLHHVVGDAYTLEEVRRATDEEVRSLAS